MPAGVGCPLFGSLSVYVIFKCIFPPTKKGYVPGMYLKVRFDTSRAIMNRIPQSENQTGVFAGTVERQRKSGKLWLSSANFQRRWPQDISPKILYRLHKARDNFHCETLGAGVPKDNASDTFPSLSFEAVANPSRSCIRPPSLQLCFSSGVLVETNVQASTTLLLKAFQSQKLP